MSATPRPHDGISGVHLTADTCLLWESAFPPQDPQIPIFRIRVIGCHNTGAV